MLRERTGNVGFITGFTARITSIVVGTGGTDIVFTTKRDDGFNEYEKGDGLLNFEIIFCKRHYSW